MFPRTIENSLSNAEARERIYRATGQFPTVTALEAPTSPLCAVVERLGAWLDRQLEEAATAPSLRTGAGGWRW